jgi:HEAT repeat protein
MRQDDNSRRVRLQPDWTPADKGIVRTEDGMIGVSKRFSTRMRLTGAAIAAVVGITASIVAAPRVSAQAGGNQVTFEKTVADLGSQDAATRLRAVQLLKAAGYPEAAVPMAPIILDPFDETQLEAIAAELNIFLADKVVPKRRVGLLVEVRNRIAAEQTFAAGPSALGPSRVPAVVATSLATASRDPNARVAVEALYAFGTLAGEVPVADRPAMLAQSGPLLAATIGATDPMLRLATIRVLGRVFARRPGDPAIEETVGDAVITALNDRETVIQEAAMWALGAMRYERAIQGLNELFQYHQRGALASSAFDALAHIGHASSLPQFVAQMSGRNLTFKLIAIEGLARTGDRSRAEAIVTAVNSERSDAIVLAGHFANVMLADGKVDAIVEALGRSKLRDQALMYIREIAASRAEIFTRHLQDPDPRIRIDIVDAIGISSEPKGLPLVEPLAKDHDAEVAKAATRAIARLRS